MPDPGSMGQAQLLSGIWELRPLRPPIATEENQSIDVHPIEHPLMVVMTAVCDLEQDFNVRFQDNAAWQSYQSGYVDESNPQLVPHALLCEVYKYDEIRPRFKGMKEIWRRIDQNQDKRYHHFAAAGIGDLAQDQLPDLYLDFRKTLAFPTGGLYDSLRSGNVNRIAVVPPVFVHDLMHRFYGYLSRVGLPTP